MLTLKKKQNELLVEFQNRQAELHKELSKKINKGFIRIQKHVDTTISNAEDRLNIIISSNDLRNEENFNIGWIILQLWLKVWWVPDHSR